MFKLVPRFPWHLAVFLAVLVVSSSASAEPASEASLELEIVRERLDNGLRVVLSPDPSAPVVSVAVYYDVGSRNEEEGRTGFAHLFEHMMFEGSENVAGGEHSELINAAGGVDNGTTSHDRTNYFQTVPSHQLELALWLESDRMRSLAVTAENFENQRAIVINEYRQSYENQPYGLAFLRVNSVAYGDYFPYAHPTIGDVQDLIDAPLEAVQHFWRDWYGPNNAVLSVAGDFDPSAALEMIRRHFGSIPVRPTPDWQDPGFQGQTAERTETIVDPLAPLPAFFVLHHIPPARSEDHYALELLADVLGDGDSSRLHRRLVQETQICAEVRAYTDDRRGPDLINFEGVVSDGHTPAEARALLAEEVDRLIRDGVNPRELEKVRNRARARFVFGLQTSLSRARRLGEFELYFGDATLLRSELSHYLAVTAEEIQEVARRYLVESTRSVVDVLPASMAPASAGDGGETPGEGASEEPASGETGGES